MHGSTFKDRSIVTEAICRGNIAILPYPATDSVRVEPVPRLLWHVDRDAHLCRCFYTVAIVELHVFPLSPCHFCPIVEVPAPRARHAPCAGPRSHICESASSLAIVPRASCVSWTPSNKSPIRCLAGGIWRRRRECDIHDTNQNNRTRHRHPRRGHGRNRRLLFFQQSRSISPALLSRQRHPSLKNPTHTGQDRLYFKIPRAPHACPPLLNASASGSCSAKHAGTMLSETAQEEASAPRPWARWRDHRETGWARILGLDLSVNRCPPGA